MAIRQRQANLVEKMLSRGSKFNFESSEEYETMIALSLYIAVENDDLLIAGMLLGKNADEYRPLGGQSSLELAATRKFPGMMALLSPRFELGRAMLEVNWQANEQLQSDLVLFFVISYSVVV